MSPMVQILRGLEPLGPHEVCVYALTLTMDSGLRCGKVPQTIIKVRKNREYV